MNHRYAFCSRDHDPDGPGEELVVGDSALYLSPRRELNNEAEGAPLGLEDTVTFLSDSSLDGAPLGLREEDEEEEEEEEESSLSNHAHEKRLERRTEIEDKSGDLEQTSEDSEEKKKADISGTEEHDTKSTNDINKVKVEQNGDEYSNSIRPLDGETNISALSWLTKDVNVHMWIVPYSERKNLMPSPISA